MKRYISILVTALLFTTWGCNKDHFADLNSNPSELSDPELRYSITKAIVEMYSNDYTNWFYSNFQYIFPWNQITSVSSSGNSYTFNEMGPFGTQNPYSGLFPQTMDVRHHISQKSDEDKKIYKAINAITYPIQIHTCMSITDLTGSMVYTEAGLASYTNPPLITPVYDNQETLFKTWLTELDNAIRDLTETEDQIQLGVQDLIYKGDFRKWAKFCNLLKLKIASRLINIDRAKALSVAAEVANSPVGYMNSLEDDFVYYRGERYYGPGDSNSMRIGYAGKNLIDFMIENLDPRVRFLFEKNGFNAEVVQAFIDTEKELPPYVKQHVNYTPDGDFDSWKAPGEPWVRYHGVPLSPNARENNANNIYFDQGNLYKISMDGVEKAYSATSLYSEKNVRTSYDYSYPTKPGGRVIQLKDNEPPLRMVLGSSAETNLYLAEFKLLGANLPNSAQDYFNTGVELSVRRADAIAQNNQMPYYSSDPIYSSSEATNAATKLKNGEIEALLQNPAYNLSSDGLEKVYIQQYINFAGTPNDMWTLVRRSGIPKKGSSYLAWENFMTSGGESVIPRRFTVSTPTEDSKNFANEDAAIKEQGFTSGENNPQILSSERLWFDKQNPDYGAGPKQ